VLVPQQEFEHEWNLLTNKAQFAEEMSRLFWVSPLVMTRRAFDEHKISEEEFFRLVRIEKSKPFSAKRGQGGNPLRTLVARNGRKFTEAILEAVREDRLTYRDGARLLGTSNKFFPELLRKPIG
jgi:Zn-dependent peptidase ImmA (M78 family)